MLREYTSVIKVQTLSEVLSTERQSAVREKIGERLLNDPQNDGFYLIDSPVLRDIAEYPLEERYFARTRQLGELMANTYDWNPESKTLHLGFLN